MGAVSVLNLFILSSSPHLAASIYITAACMLTAVTAWWLPWDRWHWLVMPACMSLAVLTILSYATWKFGGVAAGNGPYYVLLLAWLGMHYPRQVVLAAGPAILASYGVPLMLVNEPVLGLWNAITIVLIAVFVGVTLATHVQGLHRARRQVAAAERWRAALAATLAHDIRSPLATIDICLEDIRAETAPTPAALDSVLTTAARQVRRLTQLAGSLLDMERVDTGGRLRLDIVQVPAAEAVRDAAALVGMHDLTVPVPADRTVTADPDRLQQILVNLLSNAARHGAPPFVVTVEQVAGGSSIDVRDHGRGVPADRRNSLFQRFHGDYGVKGSVGLGLWIVDQLAKAHGGSAHYRPADPGSIMGVTLPDR